MATYSKLNIPLYSRSPICLFGANVLMSQRRKTVLAGGDPKVTYCNDKTKSGEKNKNPQYDYLMVETNGVIYKFPISLTEANKAQQALIDEKTPEGKFLPLKFSGMVIPTAALLEDEAPQTMRVKVSNFNSQTGATEVTEIDAPLFEAKVEGIFQLSIAATETTVFGLLKKTAAATAKAAEHPDLEEDEDELPKPTKTKSKK